MAQSAMDIKPWIKEVFNPIRTYITVIFSEISIKGSCTSWPVRNYRKPQVNTSARKCLFRNFLLQPINRLYSG